MEETNVEKLKKKKHFSTNDDDGKIVLNIFALDGLQWLMIYFFFSKKKKKSDE